MADSSRTIQGLIEPSMLQKVLWFLRGRCLYRLFKHFGGFYRTSSTTFRGCCLTTLRRWYLQKKSSYFYVIRYWVVRLDLWAKQLATNLLLIIGKLVRQLIRPPGYGRAERAPHNGGIFKWVVKTDIETKTKNSYDFIFMSYIFLSCHNNDIY